MREQDPFHELLLKSPGNHAFFCQAMPTRVAEVATWLASADLQILPTSQFLSPGEARQSASGAQARRETGALPGATIDVPEPVREHRRMRAAAEALRCDAFRSVSSESSFNRPRAGFVPV